MAKNYFITWKTPRRMKWDHFWSDWFIWGKDMAKYVVLGDSFAPRRWNLELAFSWRLPGQDLIISMQYDQIWTQIHTQNTCTSFVPNKGYKFDAFFHTLSYAYVGIWIAGYEPTYVCEILWQFEPIPSYISRDIGGTAPRVYPVPICLVQKQPSLCQ